ncbi:uncharacterized protein B0T15DRAFT_513146 [Chaetomium strumarium]|uniref:Uncharacterized protein n=1 Tax=Chaetomium strumarium TaxID=1170767 RepID=A0AAJ0GMV9_9PEZI|nr:hypothetical protein B0T15DRAFT_513146 [Chaetomium strumarium]
MKTRRCRYYREAVNGLVRAIAKFRWVCHSGMLEELRQDLEFRFNMLSTFLALMRLCPEACTVATTSFSRMPAVCFGPSTSWIFRIGILSHASHCTHTVFPERDPGHSVISAKSYVLRNVSTSEDILPSSPSIRRLRAVINPDDKVQLSVIVSYEDQDNDVCPGCNNMRAQDMSSSVEVSCQCGLSVRFYDSFDDQADPLTQLALDDVRETGLRKFVSEFFKDLEESSPFTPDKSDQKLRATFRPKVLDAEEL